MISQENYDGTVLYNPGESGSNHYCDEFNNSGWGGLGNDSCCNNVAAGTKIDMPVGSKYVDFGDLNRMHGGTDPLYIPSDDWGIYTEDKKSICPPLPEIDGMIKTCSNTTTEQKPGDTCSYTKDPTKTNLQCSMDEVELRCLDDGWRGVVPICRTPCPPFDVKGGTVSCTQPFVPVTKCEIDPSPGNMFNVDSVICEADGNWSNSVTCSKSCPVPPQPNGSKADCPRISKEGTTCNLTAADGYSCDPLSTELTCDASGIWKYDKLPTCIKVCPSPKNNDNRTYTCTGKAGAFVGGDTCTVTAAHGYSCDPISSTITCQADGTWSTDTAKCSLLPRECPDPIVPPNTKVTCPSDTLHIKGDKCSITPLPGFTCSPSPASITCGNDGKWLYPKFTCTKSQEDPPKVQGASSSCSGNTCTYTALPGYICTSSTLTYDGKSWKGSPPVCEKSPPSHPSHQSHALLYATIGVSILALIIIGLVIFFFFKGRK